MMLMTKELERKIPSIGITAEVKDPMVYAKFFNPLGSWQWFITEYDPDTKECFGFVNGDCAELGYFSLKELEELKLQMGLGIERDRGWKARPLSEVQKLVDENGRA